MERDTAPDANVFKHIDKPLPLMGVFYGEDESWKKTGDALVEELKTRIADVPDGSVFAYFEFLEKVWQTTSNPQFFCFCDVVFVWRLRT